MIEFQYCQTMLKKSILIFYEITILSFENTRKIPDLG